MKTVTPSFVNDLVIRYVLKLFACKAYPIDIRYQEKDGEDKVIPPGDKVPLVSGCPGDACEINVTVRQCYMIITEVTLCHLRPTITAPCKSNANEFSRFLDYF